MNELTGRYQKKIALTMFLLFYLQLVLPNLNELLGQGIHSISGSWNKIPLRHEITKHYQNIPSNSNEVSSRNSQYSFFEKIQNKLSAINKRTPEIGGPGQPEMSSFKSVNANDMVDLFSGDFSYNLPLLDVGGYPISMHYSSNVSMDQEASWVGLGWNLNPGTVSRSIRGLPDDFNGDSVTKVQSIKPNRTVGVSLGTDLEIAGLPKPVEVNTGIFHNTYNGWGAESGFNASINLGGVGTTSLTAGLAVTSNTQTGVNLHPSLGIHLDGIDQNNNGTSVGFGMSTNYNSRTGISALQLNASVRLQQLYTSNQMINNLIDQATSPYATISFAVPSYTPKISMPYTNHNYSFRLKLGDAKIVFHNSLLVEGYTSEQRIEPADVQQRIPAIGYLYYSNSVGHSNSLLDYNREKELSFTLNATPNIAIPQYTYDIYSISGEGTGGTFRPYRGDVGYVNDYTMKTKSASGNLALDLGFGDLFHAGVDVSVSSAYSQNNLWNSDNTMNPVLQFQKQDSTFQPIYFRNPGEKTSNTQDYYKSVGDDSLIRVKLLGRQNVDNTVASNQFLTYANGKKAGEFTVGTPLIKKNRDKRSQVISYLTADETLQFGFDKQIRSYKENTIPKGGCTDTFTIIPRNDTLLRKGHHLSQITVLNSDGRRYIYGIPAYNVQQKDVSFSVDKTGAANGIVPYDSTSDNSTSNHKGKEGIFTSETLPGYAHSFLLTAILSPDYLDIKGDGISEDDQGDAIKFNYTRVYGGTNPFAWRTPFQQGWANYNEGLKTDKRDAKATYIYGQKEVWYLNSVESKTMIAVFKLEGNRKDVYCVKTENGGLDTTSSLRRLKQIDLYAKADLIKNGDSARPIKTVHFSYSYTLCKGVAGNNSFGKLTLDSVWFSYNGNEKGKQNPYVFRYHPDSSFNNPVYNLTKYDRWGSYKDTINNPAHLKNSDFPYAEQDSLTAARNAGAWNLSEILLPSGGLMKITYESDDYAYVQNKHAQSLIKIAGIGSTVTGGPTKSLYGAGDSYYVFVNSSVTLNNKTDIYRLYLDGITSLYLKIAVQVPDDRWGRGYEWVPLYAQIEDYNLVNSGQFWIRLKQVQNESPLVRAALQFLRLNLPSKAYPESEPGDDITVWDAVKMVAASVGNMLTATQSFESFARGHNFCQSIDTTVSLIRLNVPNYKKLGGGHRVKRIEVFDNWNHMTGQKESVYGQEYQYVTSEIINGKTVQTSSGVASYEPLIGAEENPFRTAISYTEQSAPMAPVNNLYSENPLGESFFPAAMVGYSKVRVRTINRKAKSANGWQETEFFTTKDFPTLVENTLIDQDAQRSYNPKLNSFLRLNIVNHLTVSQGFKIELNDMNGKIKSQSSYAETDSIHPVSFVRNFYKVDNDKAAQKHLNNSVFLVDSLNGHINDNGIIGKDIEIMQDMREQSSHSIASNYSANVDVFIAFIVPIFVPSYLPLPQREETRFRSAATVKIIQRYGILDSVVAMDKSSLVSTKNLVYDGETGQVVVSRTNNEFNDPVYQLSYPAYWAYSGMGMAYKNLDAQFHSLKVVHGKLYYPNNLPFPTEKYFESGDEVYVKGLQALSPGFTCLDYNTIGFLGLAPYVIPFTSQGWFIDAAKGFENTTSHKKDQGLYLVNSLGTPFYGDLSFIRVMRSGKRNMLDASVGSVVSLANPVQLINGAYRLLIDSTTKVIHTSAVAYKDQWRIENSLYRLDTCYTITRDTTEVLTGTGTRVTLKKSVTNNNIFQEKQYTDSLTICASYDYIPINLPFPGIEYRTKAIVNFDFNQLKYYENLVDVSSATLSLSSWSPGSIWNHEGFYYCPFFSACRTDSNFNWDTAEYAYRGMWTSIMGRIQSAWNANTHYNDFNVTDLNKTVITDAGYGDFSANMTNLVRDVLHYKLFFYGYMMELQSPIQTSGVPHYFSVLAKSLHPGLYGPKLSIHYSYQKDTCINVCRSYVSDTLVNPYRWGILGNWKLDRAYTYYSDRKESDAHQIVYNLRQEGQLKNFTPFWTFTNNGLVNSSDTTKWVWNSASSLYNQKGFEIENYDPLGRYNSALYGYNESLPVAVAQNSLYRNILYDGFEDYHYQTKSCSTCPNPKEIDFVSGNSGVILDSSQSHTGLYSMKVSANAQGQFTSPWRDTSEYKLKDTIYTQVDSSAVTYTAVRGKGTGLTATYTGYSDSLSCPTHRTGSYNFSYSRVEGPIRFLWGDESPVTGMCSTIYDVTWNGFIQAPATGRYHFSSFSDDAIFIKVDGVTRNSSILVTQQQDVPIDMEIGKLYPIQIRYSHFMGFARPVVLWSRENSSASPSTVPDSVMYKSDMVAADSSGSFTSQVLYYCISYHSDSVKNMIRPVFSPLPLQPLVVSAWLKMDGNDCNTAPALDSVLYARYYTRGGDSSTIYLHRTGVRIEGWQRYEASVTTSWLNTRFRVGAKAPSSRAVYVDDIRVQPYNSSMKSFVYDPVSLRLMAELDENNYATFYEYDDDGTLIRVKKETERGIMTIKESRTALVKN